MASLTPSQLGTPVHLAISLVAKEGRVHELADLLGDFVQRSFSHPGVTGAHLMQPANGSGSREFRLHRSFASMEECLRFYESELYQGYQSQVASLIECDAVIRPLHGFEAFFREGKSVPPRWKMAIVTWLGVFPSVVLVSNILGPLLAPLHPILATAIITMLVVMGLAWVVMPQLTRWLKSWLQPHLSGAYVGVPAILREHQPIRSQSVPALAQNGIS